MKAHFLKRNHKEKDAVVARESCVFNLDMTGDNFDFTSSIETAIEAAKAEIDELSETEESLKKMKPDCDKLDYAIAAGSGALCGIIDIFLVGKPGESPLGNITDKWFDNRVADFAKLCGWNGKEKDSAIRFLEKKFRVPYDQAYTRAASQYVLEDLNTRNHHFKSLSHNPSLCGLFFSILDQFTNASHFVTAEEHFGQITGLISLQEADGEFQLQGKNIPAKLFCGIANWFGHLMSDVAGSSGSKGRGMGIPSPLWTWINDVIAIKRKVGIPVSELDKTINEFAIEIFDKGYDLRFQTAQLIPVLVNEITVRFLYTIRRLMGYFAATEKEEISIGGMWKACEPFSNASVKRMLTVAHGTFCMMDLGDATIRGFISGGGSFNPVEFFMRLNLPGVGRFTISLYGEAKRGIEYRKSEADARFAEREKHIVEAYLGGLYKLSEIYDDRNLIHFVDDFKTSGMYKEAFEKTVELAEKRNVPSDKIIRSKADIDAYFNNGVMK